MAAAVRLPSVLKCEVLGVGEVVLVAPVLLYAVVPTMLFLMVEAAAFVKRLAAGVLLLLFKTKIQLVMVGTLLL